MSCKALPVEKSGQKTDHLHHFRLFFQHNSKTKEKFYLFRITSRQFHIIMSYLGLFSFLSFQKLTCIKRHHDYRWTIIYTIFWHSGRNESLDQIVNLSWKNIMFSKILNNDVPIKKVISVFILLDFTGYVALSNLNFIFLGKNDTLIAHLLLFHVPTLFLAKFRVAQCRLHPHKVCNVHEKKKRKVEYG